MTTTDSTPESVRTLRRINGDAADLARLAALASQIEPELLRALRLQLLPGVDVSAEGDLWFSDVVEIRGPSSVVLGAEVLPALRRWQTSENALLAQAAAV